MQLYDASRARQLRSTLRLMTTREEGKSPFPLARVQKIIKADQEMGTVAKEAVVLIAVATELFLKRMAKASSQVAKGEKRVTVRNQDVGLVVKRSEEYHFLREIIVVEKPQAEDEDNTGKNVKEKKAKTYVEIGDGDEEMQEAGEEDVAPDEQDSPAAVDADGEDSEPVVHDSDSGDSEGPGDEGR